MMILNIDDDTDDREMLDLALRDVNPSVEVFFANDGQAGLYFLEQAKAENALPCLVVLDINMPIMDGRKTLELIRQDPALKDLPVIIFTSSQNVHDHMFFIDHANEFITKPMSPSALREIAHHLIEYCV
jgi:CheY-like chemotaxis protein